MGPVRVAGYGEVMPLPSPLEEGTGVGGSVVVDDVAGRVALPFGAVGVVFGVGRLAGRCDVVFGLTVTMRSGRRVVVFGVVVAVRCAWPVAEPLPVEVAAPLPLA